MERLIISKELNEVFNVSFLDISDHRPPTSIGRFDLGNILLAFKHAFMFLVRILNFKPDIIYVGLSQGFWGYLRDLCFIVPALLFGRSLVLHLRGSEFRSFYSNMHGFMRWLTRWVLRRTARVIVLGHSLRTIFEGLVPPDRIAVIPNGIDHTQYDCIDRLFETRRAMKKILYLGSLKKRKGVFILIKALPVVLSRHPDAEVTFAGLWQDHAERKHAENLLAQLNLDGKVRFVGEVTGRNKITLYQTHDLFVFTPVEPEGLPWSLLEAMSASLPVITSDQGAIGEVVKNKRQGLVIKPDPTSLADSIIWMFDNSDQATEMGRQGRTEIAANFSEKLYLSRLTAIFQEATRTSDRKFTSLH